MIAPLKRFVVTLLAISCAGALLSVGAYIFWLNAESVRVLRLKEQIKADGVPTCAADFFPRVPANDRNAAPPLKSAAEMIKEMPKDSLGLRCMPGAYLDKNSTARLTEKQLAEIRSFLAEPEVRKSIQLLLDAATKGECDFEREYKKGAFLELPDAAAMLMAIRLLLNHSWLLATDGDVVGAAAEIEAAMKISGFYMNDPLLITWLVGVSCEQMSLSAMKCFFETVSEPPQAVVEGLKTAVQSHRDTARSTIVRAFDGERVFFGGAIFDTLLSGKTTIHDLKPAFGLLDKSGEENQKSDWVLSIYPNLLRPLLLADQAAYLRFMADARKEILDERLPHPAPQELSVNIPKTAILTRLAAPALEPTIRKYQEFEVSLDLALLGVRAESFRIANGRYPQKLAEISPKESVVGDPFSGNDFFYITDEQNLLIYSVGSDHLDNGGKVTKGKGEKDIVWQVQRSPALPASN